MKRLDDQWQQKKRSANVHRLIQNHPIGNEIKASGKIVDKIIDEINQRRPPADPAAGGVVNLGRGEGGNGSKTGKTRYLGRMAVTSKIAHSIVASTKNSVVRIYLKLLHCLSSSWNCLDFCFGHGYAVSSCCNKLHWNLLIMLLSKALFPLSSVCAHKS